ncbi:Armadillo repeat-containing protein 8 [Trichuris trichiura]|uniref:Armadillo repeat-containing protein 8 n=1 Tax=Trichuris trichiura TaxID=36087 RepID=A0A077ZPG1_TRITR|nr:Armadillo repeat-containing protein 8 [Trichuris trichiura]
MVTPRLSSALSKLESDDELTLLESIEDLKYEIIGSNRRRQIIHERQVPAVLLSRVMQRFPSTAVKKGVVAALTLFGRGSPDFAHSLVNEGLISFLLSQLTEEPSDYAAACVACLRMLYVAGQGPPDLLRTKPDVVLILLKNINFSVDTQHDVATILMHTCQAEEDRRMLVGINAIDRILPMLFSNAVRLQLAGVNFFANLLYRCQSSCSAFHSAEYHGISAIERLFSLLSPINAYGVQLGAARCLVYLMRKGCLDSAAMKRIPTEVVPKLIRILILSPEWQEKGMKASACSALAYCIENDPNLQCIAHWNNLCPQVLGSMMLDCSDPETVTPNLPEMELNFSAALEAIAAMIGFREDICQRVLNDIRSLGSCLLGVISSRYHEMNLLLPALSCLLSLSRWVEQLRTTFFDDRIFKALYHILATSENNEVLASVTAIMCNLVLGFSPCKDGLIEAGLIERMSKLIDHTEASIKLNAVWALQNCCYRADDRVKAIVLNACPPGRILCAVTELQSDSPVVLRLLYLLMDLLTNKPFVDVVMSTNGVQIMQIVIFILEGPFSVYAKEVALMILVHITDGGTSKDFLINNEDILNKIANYMQYGCLRLQMASVRCVCNLLWKEEYGFTERQVRLRDVGILKILQQLLNVTDPALFDLVKLSLQQV